MRGQVNGQWSDGEPDRASPPEARAGCRARAAARRRCGGPSSAASPRAAAAAT